MIFNFKHKKPTGNAWKCDIIVPMAHSRQCTLKDTVVPLGCGRSSKTTAADPTTAVHDVQWSNEAMRNKSGYWIACNILQHLETDPVESSKRWKPRHREQGAQLEVGIFWPGCTLWPSPCGAKEAHRLCDAATVLVTLLKGSYFMNILILYHICI